MAKYKELATEYGEWIDGLRADIEKYHRMLREYDELKEAQYQSGDAYDVPDRLVELFQTLPEMENDLRMSIRDVEMMIEEEYAGVPFRDARNRSIEAFWREVGGALSI